MPLFSLKARPLRVPRAASVTMPPGTFCPENSGCKPRRRRRCRLRFGVEVAIRLASSAGFAYDPPTRSNHLQRTDPETRSRGPRFARPAGAASMKSAFSPTDGRFVPGGVEPSQRILLRAIKRWNLWPIERAHPVPNGLDMNGGPSRLPALSSGWKMHLKAALLWEVRLMERSSEWLFFPPEEKLGNQTAVSPF